MLTHSGRTTSLLRPGGDGPWQRQVGAGRRAAGPAALGGAAPAGVNAGFLWRAATPKLQRRATPATLRLPPPPPPRSYFIQWVFLYLFNLR